MKLHHACGCALFGLLAAALPAEAYFTTCPGIERLTAPVVWADANCTIPISGASWQEPDTLHEFWVGGGRWFEVRAVCEGMGADSGDHQGSDTAEYFYFGLNDYNTHQCTATFDAAYGSPYAAPIKWTVRRAAQNQKAIACDASYKPLTFSCHYTEAGTAVAGQTLYYKVSAILNGHPFNALEVLLDSNYESNGAKTATTTSAFTGATDSAGDSKVHLYLDFRKMTDRLDPLFFPSSRYPLTIRIAASPDGNEPLTSFDIKLDHIGNVDQIYVVEPPGCLSPLNCSVGFAVQPHEWQRTRALAIYRGYALDNKPRVVLTRPSELGSREIVAGDPVQGGDQLHFDVNGVIRTHCPSCAGAVRADGTAEPAWVIAKLSFLDGVTGMVGVNSDSPGTFDIALGKMASINFSDAARRFYYWGSQSAARQAAEWVIQRLNPTVGAALTVQSGIEMIGTLDSLSRSYFVNIKSTVHGQSDRRGAGTLTTLEGEGTVFLPAPETNVGAVSAGFTGELNGAAAAPQVRLTSAAEAQRAYEKLSLLNNSCSAERALYNNMNTGGCGYSQSAGFNLAQPVSVTRIQVWYNTKVGGASLNYTLTGPDKTLTGVLTPVGCDPYQTQWCLGEAAVNQTFAAGSYTITTDKTAVCQNTGSQGNGFSVIHGCSAVLKSAPATNYQGLWWGYPAGSESGWGINFAHQGDIIFATWFTYDAAGKPWWLIATLKNAGGGNAYSGKISTVSGPPFNAATWDRSTLTSADVGTMTVTFGSTMTGTLAYTVNGVTQTKAITQQVFGPLPACTWGAQSDLTLATNYQDLWWNAPAESESGWGINLTHQGDVIFATWYTYDVAGKPWWLIADLRKTAAGTYAGTVYTVTGPAFNAVPFDPAKVAGVSVGTATVSFANGNSASFAYTVNGTARTKSITRQVFVPPGTVCR